MFTRKGIRLSVVSLVSLTCVMVLWNSPAMPELYPRTISFLDALTDPGMSLRNLVNNPDMSSEAMTYARELFNVCRTNNNDTELLEPCPHQFESTLEGNLAKVRTYPIPDEILNYFPMLGLDRFVERDLNNTLPTLVTGASDNHYFESQKLIKEVHEKIYPEYPGIRFIFYDLGLSPEHLYLMKKYCRCEVRSTPFDQFPNHTRIVKNISWKPLLIQLVLKETGAVFWVDASIRFKTANFDDAIEHSRKLGIGIWVAIQPITSVGDPRTFAFLGEPRCLYRDLAEIETGKLIVYQTNFTFYNIMRPWLSCALSRDCINPSGSEARGCHWKKPRYLYRCCHRIEQSVISIILNRIFQFSTHRHKLEPRTFYVVRRDEGIKYFEKLENTTEHPAIK